MKCKHAILLTGRINNDLYPVACPACNTMIYTKTLDNESLKQQDSRIRHLIDQAILLKPPPTNQ